MVLGLHLPGLQKFCDEARLTTTFGKDPLPSRSGSPHSSLATSTHFRNIPDILDRARRLGGAAVVELLPDENNCGAH